jgi:hypothetical protein
MKPPRDRTYFVDTELSRHGVEVFGDQDKILSRRMNVRPAFPCKGIGTPP